MHFFIATLISEGPALRLLAQPDGVILDTISTQPWNSRRFIGFKLGPSRLSEQDYVDCHECARRSQSRNRATNASASSHPWFFLKAECSAHHQLMSTRKYANLKDLELPEIEKCSLCCHWHRDWRGYDYQWQNYRGRHGLRSLVTWQLSNQQENNNCHY